jgi:hypothetical protein
VITRPRWPPRKKNGDPLAEWQVVMLFGYQFQIYLNGWRKFCAGLKVDPEVHWKKLPGFDTVQQADELSAQRPGQWPPGIAYTEEGVARYRAREQLGDPEADIDDKTMDEFRPMTAIHVANSLRMVWRELLAKWNLDTPNPEV